ncbi:MAG: hypothetical protein DI535_07060 [Citrobacter freundii]|nr:MAG: hypothetical protein DI535_07060 [Citrobacter freundii]
MKKWFIIYLLLLTNQLTAQPGYGYDSLTAKAGLFHLQRNAKKAISIFEEAFILRQPDALTAYKTAGVYALDSNAGKAFRYLTAAIDSGWTEAGWLVNDDYFDWLKQTQKDKWDAVITKAVAKEKIFEATLQLPALRQRINTMTLQDQQLRYKRVQAKSKEERKIINAAIAKADADNLLAAKEIIAQYGWPGISQIGKDGQNNLWLVVQHADMDVAFQRNALAAMKKLLGTKELNAENYAFLYDRVQCNLNYKQLYGTQVNWTSNGEASGFRSIADEDKVDDRRRKLGVLPLHIYALTYGFTYTLPAKEYVIKRESQEQAWLKTGRDSGAYYYRQQNFDKVYDIYNDASAVQGGMSSEDNYKAAILFAKIAAINKQEKFSSISLDFLYLLFQRGEVNRKRWLAEKSFAVLHTNERWKSMLVKVE